MPGPLPVDVWDQILTHISNSSDILNVALASKDLLSIAIPYHLHYRDIRSRLTNPSLWTWLSRLEDLHAAQIRSLTILPDQDEDFYSVRPAHSYDLRERLPPDFTPSDPIPLTARRDIDLYRQCEAAIVSTLKRMTSLERFRWYRIPRPLLRGENDIWTTLQVLGTVKEIDVYDAEDPEVEAYSILTTETFLRFKDLTTLKIRSSIYKASDPEVPQGLQTMLLNNFPELEVLAFELDLIESIDGTADFDDVLISAHWPKLRVLRLRGVNCRVGPLVQFLAAHSGIEELALAQMMPGHAWTQLERDLPSDALPNLRHLECSSAQAAALLKYPRPKVHMLLGVEVHDTIVDSLYFSWDEAWEDEEHEGYDENAVRESPWKAMFLDRLRAQQSIRRLGISTLDSLYELEVLSTVVPQITELHIDDWDFQATESEWHRVCSLFPSLEVLGGSRLIWFDPYADELEASAAEKVDTQIQALAKACQNLRVIILGPHAKKAIIIRDTDPATCGVKWVVRNWMESEEGKVHVGEKVYGL